MYSPYGNRYKFNNKPNALAHWAERPKAERDQAGPAGNEAVVLVDPDFLFLARFKLPVDKAVSGNHPAAQSYGLGDQWLSFNLSKICGAGSLCTRVTSQDVYKVKWPIYFFQLLS